MQLTSAQQEAIRFLIVVIGGVVSVISIWRALIAGWKAFRKWRETHPSFRRTMLRTLERLEIQVNELDAQAKTNRDALERLEGSVARSDEYFSAMLRERLESAYTMYAVRMGWCPSGEKRMLMDLFELHESRGWNHINQKYKEIIADLPESEAEKERES